MDHNSTFGQIERDATHYEILGVSSSLLNDNLEPAQLLKRAYHRALLRNHPDKARKHSAVELAVTQGQRHPFTVDQISHAFGVLSDEKKRGAYDRELKLASSSQGHQREPNFQTGIEIVDLDDLEYDDGQDCWFKACRCGNERGFLFTEADLEDAADLGELLVGCADCSLWLKVQFADVGEDDNSRPTGADSEHVAGKSSPTARLKESQ